MRSVLLRLVPLLGFLIAHVATIEISDILRLFHFSFEREDRSENLDFLLNVLHQRLQDLEYKPVQSLPAEEFLEIMHLHDDAKGTFEVASTQCQIEKGRIFSPRDFQEIQMILGNNVSEIWVSLERGPAKSYTSAGWPLAFDVKVGEQISTIQYPKTWKQNACHILRVQEAKVAVRDCSKVHRFLCLVRSPTRQANLRYNDMLKQQKDKAQLMKTLLHPDAVCLDIALIDPTKISDDLVFEMLSHLHFLKELYAYWCGKIEALNPLSQTTVSSTVTSEITEQTDSTNIPSTSIPHTGLPIITTSSTIPAEQRNKRESLTDTATAVCTRVSSFITTCGELSKESNLVWQLKHTLFRMTLADLVNVTLTVVFLMISLWIAIKIKVENFVRPASPPRFSSSESIKNPRPGGSRA